MVVPRPRPRLSARIRRACSRRPPGTAQLAELERRWDRMLQEDIALIQEQRFGRTRFALKALAMPPSIVPHAAKVLGTSELPGMRAKLGAIGVLTRLRLWRTARMLRLVFDNAMPMNSRPETHLR